MNRQETLPGLDVPPEDKALEEAITLRKRDSLYSLSFFVLEQLKEQSEAHPPLTAKPFMVDMRLPVHFAHLSPEAVNTKLAESENHDAIFQALFNEITLLDFFTFDPRKADADIYRYAPDELPRLKALVQDAFKKRFASDPAAAAFSDAERDKAFQDVFQECLKDYNSELAQNIISKETTRLSLPLDRRTIVVVFDSAETSYTYTLEAYQSEIKRLEYPGSIETNHIACLAHEAMRGAERGKIAIAFSYNQTGKADPVKGAIIIQCFPLVLDVSRLTLSPEEMAGFPEGPEITGNEAEEVNRHFEQHQGKPGTWDGFAQSVDVYFPITATLDTGDTPLASMTTKQRAELWRCLFRDIEQHYHKELEPTKPARQARPPKATAQKPEVTAPGITDLIRHPLDVAEHLQNRQPELWEHFGGGPVNFQIVALRLSPTSQRAYHAALRILNDDGFKSLSVSVPLDVWLNAFGVEKKQRTTRNKAEYSPKQKQQALDGFADLKKQECSIITWDRNKDGTFRLRHDFRPLVSGSIGGDTLTQEEVNRYRNSDRSEDILSKLNTVTIDYHPIWIDRIKAEIEKSQLRYFLTPANPFEKIGIVLKGKRPPACVYNFIQWLFDAGTKQRLALRRNPSLGWSITIPFLDLASRCQLTDQISHGNRKRARSELSRAAEICQGCGYIKNFSWPTPDALEVVFNGEVIFKDIENMDRGQARRIEGFIAESPESRRLSWPTGSAFFDQCISVLLGHPVYRNAINKTPQQKDIENYRLAFRTLLEIHENHNGGGNIPLTSSGLIDLLKAIADRCNECKEPPRYPSSYILKTVQTTYTDNDAIYNRCKAFRETLQGWKPEYIEKQLEPIAELAAFVEAEVTTPQTVRELVKKSLS